MSRSDPMLRFESVTRRYLRRGVATCALDAVSLAIEPGEFVAITGPSGSGKSTLLHLAAALDVPSEGRVLIAGHDAGAMTETARTDLRRGRIGLVFQFFNLLPSLVVERNVALPLLIDGRGLAAARPRVRELLGLVGLAGRDGRYPDELSGGEMQRVAIARALISAPELLLADEPTGNLDSATGRDIIRLLIDTGRRDGRTTLLVTHDPSIAALADRTIRLRDGRLDGDGAVP